MSKVKVYYAIKFKDGKYLHNTGGTAPALYTSPSKAVATMKVRMKYYGVPKQDEYEVVTFAEVL